MFGVLFHVIFIAVKVKN